MAGIPSQVDEELTLPALDHNIESFDQPASDRPCPDSPSTQHTTDPYHSCRLFADSKAAGEEITLLFDPLDYPDKDEREFHLDAFLKKNAPSKVKRSDGIGKIIVRSPSYVDEGTGEEDKIMEEWNKLILTPENIKFPAIKELALTHGCVSGMWLLFDHTAAKIDMSWENIARATVDDKLGTHAKVTPCEDKQLGKELHKDQHAISVYIKNFNNKKEVMNLEIKLRDLGMKGRMSFKPRVYSIIGVYADNEWDLRPGIFTSHWDPSTNLSKVRDNVK